jgi:hypothetical protein
VPASDDDTQGSADRWAVARAWLAWWVLCAALWLALIDRTTLDVLLAGVVAAAFGATAAVLVRQQRRTLMRPRTSWLAAACSPGTGNANERTVKTCSWCATICFVGPRHTE